MNYRFHLLSFFFLVSTSACSFNTQSLAEKHLDLIKSGQASQANNQYCNTGEALMLHTVKSFKVKSSQEKNESNLSWTEVIADIETDQHRFKNESHNGIIAPKKEILTQVKIEVWKSDSFYERAVKSTAKFNDVMRSSSVFLGRQHKDDPVPERNKISKESLCIFLPFEQFKND